MRGLSLMIQRLIRMIQDVFLQSVSYIVLTMVVSLVALETYLALSNWDWWVVGSLMPLTVISLLTLLWLVGEKESHKRSVPQGLAARSWADGEGFWEIPCPHCGKLTIIRCRAALRIFSTQRPSKSPKRSRTRR